jgi:hypothetical protein
LLRWASSMVSSLCCAMPLDYAPSSPPKSDTFHVRPFPSITLAILRPIVI